MLKWIGVAGMVMALVGCATPYAPKSFWNDGGFSELQVRPGVWQVRFHGNEFTDLERTQHFAMLRASELCLSQGAAHVAFGAVDSKSVASTYIPGQSTSTTYGNASAYAHGDQVRIHGSATTYTTATPGTLLYRPQSGLLAACLRSPTDVSYDAAFLLQSLRAHYRM